MSAELSAAALPATLLCPWCDQPLGGPALGAAALCPACGAATTAGWPAQRRSASSVRRYGADGRDERPGAWSLAGAIRRRTRRRLAARLARIAPPGAILAVGGDAQLLDALRDAGRIVAGGERGPCDVTELGGRYAAVVFWHALGRARAPRAALDHAAALLKPGGVLTVVQQHQARPPAGALGLGLRARGIPHQRVTIPPGAVVARLRALGLHVEPAVAPPALERAVGRGGTVAIEARRT